MYNVHFFNQNFNIKTGGMHYIWVYLYMCGYVEKYHICGLKVGHYICLTRSLGLAKSILRRMSTGLKTEGATASNSRCTTSTDTWLSRFTCQANTETCTQNQGEGGPEVQLVVQVHLSSKQILRGKEGLLLGWLYCACVNTLGGIHWTLFTRYVEANLPANPLMLLVSEHSYLQQCVTLFAWCLLQTGLGLLSLGWHSFRWWFTDAPPSLLAINCEDQSQPPGIYYRLHWWFWWVALMWSSNHEV